MLKQQITKIPGNKREHVPAENMLTTLTQAGIDRNLSSRAEISGAISPNIWHEKSPRFVFK
jgi:hypothetical protein